jgi:hypothetical protein
MTSTVIVLVHAIKTYRKRRGIAPPILKLGIRYGSSSRHGRSTHRYQYSLGLNRRLGRPQGRSCLLGADENLLNVDLDVTIAVSHPIGCHHITRIATLLAVITSHVLLPSRTFQNLRYRLSFSLGFLTREDGTDTLS